MMAREKRVSATAIQTVGVKGHDGFALALVTTNVRTALRLSARRRRDGNAMPFSSKTWRFPVAVVRPTSAPRSTDASPGELGEDRLLGARHIDVKHRHLAELFDEHDRAA